MADAAARTNRSSSDVTSGREVSHRHYERYPGFSVESLNQFFAEFKNFDLDDTGFISPTNLLEVLCALGVAGLDEGKVCSMIEEVAILSGHSNDGRLSFYDFLGCIQYERDATAHNDKVTAAKELRLSMSEPLVFGTDEEEEDATGTESERRETIEDDEQQRGDGSEQDAAEDEDLMRQPSFALVRKIVTSRIDTFQQAVETNARLQQRANDAAARTAQGRFASKLQKFRRIESELSEPKLNNEEMHTAALRTKLQAFELASQKAATPLEFKRSWRNIQARPSSWRRTTVFAGGVAPKKSLSDLP